MPELLKYTVLLLYPDYMAENYGEDTYLAWVEAVNTKQAVRKAQIEAMRAQGGQPGVTADDFLPLFACSGHHIDLFAVEK